MSIFKIVFLCLGLLFLCVFAWLYYKQEALLLFPRKLSQDHRFSFPFPFEEYYLQVKGSRLHAIHATLENPKGMVVYFHGNAGDLSSWGGIAEDFLPLGYELLIVDYRGYGKSTAAIHAQEEFFADAEVVYQKASELFPTDKLVLYGRSLGTGIASYIAAKYPAKALVLETPYYSMQSLAELYYAWVPSFLLRYKLKTYTWINQVSCPIYMIHGDTDEIIPWENAKRLSQVIQKKHEFVTVEGGFHNNLNQFPEYKEFLNRVLQ